MNRNSPKEILETILGHLGFHAEVQEQDSDGHLVLQIRTSEPERLIGRREETLESLQYLVNRILFSQDRESRRVTVDVEHHRTMRDDAFLRRIRQLSDAVRENGRPVQTEPLNSYDRRLVHNAFRDDPEIASESPEGPEKIKRIRISRRDAS